MQLIYMYSVTWLIWDNTCTNLKLIFIFGKCGLYYLVLFFLKK